MADDPEITKLYAREYRRPGAETWTRSNPSLARAEPPPKNPAGETVEPGVIRLNGVQSALIDQLVDARQRRRGGEARVVRRDIVGEVLARGVMAIQAEEGCAP